MTPNAIAADRRREAWEHASRAAAPIPEAADLDHGPQGLAALARTSSIVVIEGRARGSVASERITVRRYMDECQVDALNTRGQLSDRLWRAGILFRGAWLSSAQLARVCAAYSPPTGSQGEDVPLRRLAARRRVDEALEALQAGRHQAAVIGVCGQDEPCAGRLRSLQEALDTLSRHYKIEANFCRDAKRR